ncbi:MAG: hypothetical protein KJN99_04125 [Marinicaulis sp.]|nr:hypothetical protein [Marinicaulis sp.]
MSLDTPPSYYEEAAPGIASWTVPLRGALLLYVVFDVALGILLLAGKPVLTMQLMGSLRLALIGGMLGSRLAVRRR